MDKRDGLCNTFNFNVLSVGVILFRSMLCFIDTKLMWYK